MEIARGKQSERSKGSWPSPKYKGRAVRMAITCGEQSVLKGPKAHGHPLSTRVGP